MEAQAERVGAVLFEVHSFCTPLSLGNTVVAGV